jgi:beta-lactam-binding protein with PASTA domain
MSAAEWTDTSISGGFELQQFCTAYHEVVPSTDVLRSGFVDGLVDNGVVLLDDSTASIDLDGMTYVFSPDDVFDEMASRCSVTFDIPAVVGMRASEARRAIDERVGAAGEGASLDVDVVHKFTAAGVGTVLSTAPAAGVEVDSGSSVRLTVGRPLPAMPDVVGLRVDGARRELTELGLTVRTRRQATFTEKRETVLVQSIQPGVKVIPAKTTVVLTYAKPPEGWFVRVEGTGTALVTWGNIGGTSQATVSLPWSVHVGTSGSYDVVTVVAQRQSGSSGAITCEVIESGFVEERNVASGPYAVCSASA